MVMGSSSESSDWLKAVLHNNIGIESMLHSEHRQEALQLLGKALTALKSERRDQKTSSSHFALDENSRQNKVSAEKSLENILVRPLTLSLQESPEGQGSDYSLRSFVYQKPMRLVPVGSILSAPMTTTSRNAIHTLLSSAIVFNVALTMHLLALEDHFSNACIGGAKGAPALSGVHGEKGVTEATKLLLARAIHLYILAMELLYGGLRHQANDLIYVASLNNLAQAYSMLGEREKSQECFQKLLALMLLHTDARMIDRGVAILPHDLLEGSWSNLTHFVFPAEVTTQLAVAA